MLYCLLIRKIQYSITNALAYHCKIFFSFIGLGPRFKVRRNMFQDKKLELLTFLYFSAKNVIFSKIDI